MRRTGLTLLLCLACFGTFAGTAAAAPSIESVSFLLSSSQAGAHADLSASIALEDAGDPETARGVRFGLPPGFFLYPDTGPHCPATAFGEDACPISTTVGTVALVGDYEGDPNHEFEPAPLFLLSPQAGELARLGFTIPEVGLPVVAPVTVRPDQGLDLHLQNLPQTVPLASVAVALWGVPADPVHDEERGGVSSAPENPFTRNPTSCGGAGSLAVQAESWEDPGEFAAGSALTPSIVGCGKLPFSPSLNASLTSTETSAPSGLDLSFGVPADLSPGGLSGADAKTIELALPAELSLDEGALAGSTACSAAQAHLGGGPNECPAASELGAVEGSVAGVEAPLEGSLYFGGSETPDSYRFFLIATGGGIDLRREVTLAFDQTSEAWEIALPNLPQLPIDALEMQLAIGDGPFLTPWECGAFEAVADFGPWSGGSPFRVSDGLEVETGPEGGPCPGPAEDVVVELDPSSLPADGTSTTTATATVSDANGYLVPGEEIVFESTDPQQQIGPVTDHGDGTYTARITASTVPGTSLVFAYDESVTAEVFGLAELTQTALPAPPPLPAANPSLSVAPVVKLRGRPAKKTYDRTPTFRFSSSVPGSRFQCKVDKLAPRGCRSPLTLAQLPFGRHTFKVRAVAPNGLASAFVSFGFAVRRR
jgi:hypothetical protein